MGTWIVLIVEQILIGTPCLQKGGQLTGSSARDPLSNGQGCTDVSCCPQHLPVHATVVASKKVARMRSVSLLDEQDI